jgi:hypothetical protein
VACLTLQYFFHYLKTAGFSKITAHKMGWKWQLRRGDMEKLQGYNFRGYQTLCTSKNTE